MKNPVAWTVGLVAVLVGTALLSIAFGAVWISPAHVISALADGLRGGGEPRDWQAAIVLSVRLPRTLLALVGGAGLGIAGASMQGLFRNPMADPGVLGVSAGGALGAVTALYACSITLSAFAAPVGAFVGAVACAAIVYAIASSGGRTSTETLLLAGIAVSGVASALTSFVLSVSVAQWELGREMIAWLMGGLDRASWGELAFLVVPVVVGALGILGDARALDVLATGEESAIALGVDLPRLVRRVLVFASLITAATVSVMGIVAFVGLLVPHMVRRLVGPAHRRLIPLSGLLGAWMLMLAELVCRVLPGAGLRLGVVTSLAGGPFFLYLVMRRARQVTL